VAFGKLADYALQAASLGTPPQRCECDCTDRRSYSPHGLGNLGDSKGLRGGVMELRIDYGPGYRVYYVRRGAKIVILLCGGDKRTQQRDIKRARELAERL
jgi:putative addiction module killer protein